MRLHENHIQWSSSSPFSETTLKEICAKACNDLTNSEYDSSKAEVWTEAVIQKIVNELRAESPNFKYIVQCTIGKVNTSGAMHTSLGTYWNADRDGIWKFKWDGGKIEAIITILWIHTS